MPTFVPDEFLNELKVVGAFYILWIQYQTIR
jgi:threonine/homoserine/homoserine lactone efflux protein